MTNELNELEQLKLKEKQLKEELSSVVGKIEAYNLVEVYKTYGPDAACENCRFSASIGCTPTHDYCGYPGAPCYCCHKICEHYLPDTKYTKWIKTSLPNSKQIGCNIVNAIKLMFRIDLLQDEEIPDHIWTLIQDFLTESDNRLY